MRKVPITKVIQVPISKELHLSSTKDPHVSITKEPEKEKEHSISCLKSPCPHNYHCQLICDRVVKCFDKKDNTSNKGFEQKTYKDIRCSLQPQNDSHL